MRDEYTQTEHCALCAAVLVPLGCGAGYGRTADGAKHCYQCCSQAERARMVETGRATLYWSDEDGRATLSNWSGVLAFHVVRQWAGRHNLPRCKRRTGRFIGPDGAVWSATFIDSGHTMLAHCRRTKLEGAWA